MTHDFAQLAKRFNVDPELLNPWSHPTADVATLRAYLAYRADHPSRPAPAWPLPHTASEGAERHLASVLDSPSEGDDHPREASPEAPSELRAAANAETSPAGAYTEEAEGREQYVALPRDLLTVWRAEYERLLAGRSAGVTGRPAGAHRSSDPFVLAALYDLARKETGRVIVEPEELVAATGRAKRELLRRDLAPDGPLRHWVKGLEVIYRSSKSTREWKILLVPENERSFLRVPKWWLWEAGTRRFREGMSPSSPALIAALAVANVADYKTHTTDKYGRTGLARMAGVSAETMKAGLIAANRLGMIIEERGEHGQRSTRRVNHQPPCGNAQAATDSHDAERSSHQAA